MDHMRVLNVNVIYWPNTLILQPERDFHGFVWASDEETLVIWATGFQKNAGII